MAEISRQPRPGGRVAQSTTEATANADGEPAGTAASYTADGENVPGGAATIASRASTIAFDGSAGTGELLPGPADLLAAALAACILKNVERFSGLLPFTYQHARVHVELERQEPPPRIVRARYTLRINTNEPDHRVQLLHRNILRFGIITNTAAGRRGRSTRLPDPSRRSLTTWRCSATPAWSAAASTGLFAYYHLIPRVLDDLASHLTAKERT